jgi:alkylated DNA repair protein alkB family protein 7
LARDLYYDKVLPDRAASGSTESDEPFEQPLQTSTHALHLAPGGSILPHVDNVDASGTVIIGVSLGADRILRLEEATQDGRETKIVHKGWDVLLKSGSLYLQK